MLLVVELFDLYPPFSGDSLLEGTPPDVSGVSTRAVQAGAVFFSFLRPISVRFRQGCGIKGFFPTSVIPGNPPLYYQSSVLEALSVVSQKWSLPTALVSGDGHGGASAAPGRCSAADDGHLGQLLVPRHCSSANEFYHVRKSVFRYQEA